jgi:hypothetical protein
MKEFLGCDYPLGDFGQMRVLLKADFDRLGTELGGCNG